MIFSEIHIICHIGLRAPISNIHIALYPSNYNGVVVSQTWCAYSPGEHTQSSSVTIFFRKC